MEQVLCYWPDPACPEAAAARRAMLPLKLRVRTAGPEQTGPDRGPFDRAQGISGAGGGSAVVTEPS